MKLFCTPLPTLCTLWMLFSTENHYLQLSPLLQTCSSFFVATRRIFLQLLAVQWLLSCSCFALVTSISEGLCCKNKSDELWSSCVVTVWTLVKEWERGGEKARAEREGQDSKHDGRNIWQWWYWYGTDTEWRKTCSCLSLGWRQIETISVYRMNRNGQQV